MRAAESRFTSIVYDCGPARTDVLGTIEQYVTQLCCEAVLTE